MSIESELSYNPVYLHIHKFAKENNIPVNVGEKTIGYGKYTNFYLFYVGRYSGKLQVRVRKYFNIDFKNNLLIYELDSNNLIKIENALISIYRNYKSNVTEIPEPIKHKKVLKVNKNDYNKALTSDMKDKIKQFKGTTKKLTKLEHSILTIIDDLDGENKVYVSTIKRILQGNTESRVAIKYSNKYYFGLYPTVTNHRIRQHIVKLLRRKAITAHEGYKEFLYYKIHSELIDVDDDFSDYELAILKVMMEVDD